MPYIEAYFSHAIKVPKSGQLPWKKNVDPSWLIPSTQLGLVWDQMAWDAVASVTSTWWQALKEGLSPRHVVSGSDRIQPGVLSPHAPCTVPLTIYIQTCSRVHRNFWKFSLELWAGCRGLRVFGGGRPWAPFASNPHTLYICFIICSLPLNTLLHMVFCAIKWSTTFLMVTWHSIVWMQNRWFNHFFSPDYGGL